MLTIEVLLNVINAQWSIMTERLERNIFLGLAN